MANRRKKPTPEELAERAAADDRALLESLQAQKEAAQTEAEPPTPQHAINDVFVAMVAQIRDTKLQLTRDRTPLSEPTLVKVMETALQFVAWDYQRRLQEQRNPMEQFMAQQQGEGEFIGPEPDETISEAQEEANAD